VEFRLAVHGYLEYEGCPKFNVGEKARDLRLGKDLIWPVDIIMRDQQ
jgi:hypothetical protein